MNEKKYEEVGHAYRFFLGWRHAAFAGNIVVLYGVVSLCVSLAKDAPLQLWVVPLGASPLGVFFWWIDRRTRDLYHAAMNAGKELEGEEGGFYTHLSKIALPAGSSAFSRASQSGALSTFFLGSSAVLLITGISLCIRQFCR
ncbi:hypothetical protein KIH07_11615 [Hydrogenophaga taeniospiralis]|uniref:hypothetical protein n=1 Tax=Hydrogenophaga taeniospiralis TaxID=65656 RepID=UPI001CFAE117|nr:hypothetical protein [Hydrogenophaga taeniospiralis]MCB4364386.1 hypothetical protein [Hydrogenophaga taeniospiralis]